MTELQKIAQPQQPVIVPRAVSMIDMLNIINDKLDYLLMRFDQETKK